jgi:cytochrome P450
VSFAAIHTSSMATTHAILDLASRREYIQPLRDEIDEIRKLDGEEIDGDGYVRLKKDSINKLRKLDSFMKESQRFSPPIYSTFPLLEIRRIVADVLHSFRHPYLH